MQHMVCPRSPPLRSGMLSCHVPIIVSLLRIPRKFLQTRLHDFNHVGGKAYTPRPLRLSKHAQSCAITR